MVEYGEIRRVVDAYCASTWCNGIAYDRVVVWLATHLDKVKAQILLASLKGSSWIFYTSLDDFNKYDYTHLVGILGCVLGEPYKVLPSIYNQFSTTIKIVLRPETAEEILERKRNEADAEFCASFEDQAADEDEEEDEKGAWAERNQYLNLVDDILKTGEEREDRTGVGTLSKFGQQMRFSLHDSFPLLTTKKVPWKIIVKELLWFISGNTNAKILQDNDVHIWDGNSSRKYLDSVGLKDREEGDIGPCFVAGTPVLTFDGYKSIENVTKDDKLFTHLGHWQSIDECMSRQYVGNLVHLRLRYHYEDIICTPEHPFLARTFSIKRGGEPERKQFIVSERPGFLTAGEIAIIPRVFIGLKISDKESIPTFQLERYVNQNVPNVIYSKILNDDEWWLMGYYLGNGWMQKEKYGERIVFAIPDKKADFVVNRLQRVLPIRQVGHEPSACEKYRVHSREFAQILQNFGKYAHGKLIPNFVHQAPKLCIQLFLDGYIEADGCEESFGENTVIRITTVSRDIALSVQRLYLKLGKLASVCVSRRNGTTSVIRRGKLSRLRDAYEIKVYKQTPRRNNWSFIEDGYAWFDVCSSQTFPTIQSVPVYNFSVVSDNTYTVNNATTHNCYGFQWRHFGAKYVDCHTDYTGQGFDQLADVIHKIKNDPTNRRICMSAWNPADLKLMALPPCHLFVQFYVHCSDMLSCQVYMRSCDMGLGAPFNIASYALLTSMIAHMCGKQPFELVICMGDTHIYRTHITALNEQIQRKARPFPTLKFARPVESIDDFTVEDPILMSYDPLPAIKMEMAI